MATNNTDPKKRIKFLWAKLLIISSGLLIGFAPAVSPPVQVPVIFHSSWRIDPGEIIGIYGGRLLPAQADAGSTPVVMALALSNYSGEISANHATLKLPVINAQENVIQAMLPPSAEKDVYALWVRSAGGTSDLVFINRAEPWWLSERTVFPGQVLRLVGRNFVHPRHRSPLSAYQSTPPLAGMAAELVAVGSGEQLPVHISAVSDFAMDFKVPASVKEGSRYTLRLTNGAGGEMGWVRLPEEESFLVVSGIVDPLGLNAAWTSQIPWDRSINVKDIGAKGDGVTDDSEAIQRAVDKAATAGGGVVYLPAGTYMFSGLKLREQIVLLGQGRDMTRLVYNGQPTPTPPNPPGSSYLIGGKQSMEHSWPSKLIYSEASAVGLARLTVESHIERPADDQSRRIAGLVTMVQFDSGKERGTETTVLEVRGRFLKDVRLQSVDGGGVVIRGTSDVIIEDCDIDVTHGPLDLRVSEGYQRIRNNVFTNTQRPGIIGVNRRAWIEGNTLIGRPIARPYDKADKLGTSEHRVMDLGPSDIYLANNRIDGSWGKPGSNEGEGICWQGAKRLAYSRVTSGGENVLVDDTQNWTTDAFRGAMVVIIAGRGLGQMRMISRNTGQKITVSQPWQIEPDKNSIYTVDPSVTTRCILAGNQIVARLHKGGIVLYTKDYDNVIIGNTLTNTGGIWLTSTQVPQQMRADFSYFAYVAYNRITGASTSFDQGNGKGNSVTIGPGVDGGIVATPSPELPAVGIYGQEVRNNSLTGIGTDVPCENASRARFVRHSGIYVSSPSILNLPVAQGLIIEGNRVTNTFAGVHLSNTSYDVILHDNDFSGNAIDIANDNGVRVLQVRGDDTTPTSPPIKRLEFPPDPRTVPAAQPMPTKH
jgi:hypothetical protein